MKTLVRSCCCLILFHFIFLFFKKGTIGKIFISFLCLSLVFLLSVLEAWIEWYCWSLQVTNCRLNLSSLLPHASPYSHIALVIWFADSPAPLASPVPHVLCPQRSDRSDWDKDVFCITIPCYPQLQTPHCICPLCTQDQDWCLLSGHYCKIGFVNT